MPLSEVREGMQCEAVSVVKGINPVRFGAEVLDVVEGDPSSDGPRILIRVFGDAVETTGVGPGFSGSPIYCPDAQGRAASIGAISESVGEYGGKVLLATPIEAILGNPPEAPGRANKRPDVMRRAQKLSAPLTVSGLSRPLAGALTRAAAKRNLPILAVPSGPLRAFPPQALQPGSAMGVGYSSGDVTVGAVGTVAYVDGDKVWSFGHELDAAGRRSLLLQDAYVYRVINNPNALGELGSTYKLASAAHDVGTLSNDALSAVVGRMGALPRTVPVRVTARDQDTGARQSVTSNVADETDIDDPLGSPLVAFIAPLAIAQASTAVLRSTPGKLSGDACVEIGLRELKRPLRFCNRYVGDSPAPGAESGIGSVVAAGAGADAEIALSIIGSYTGRALHVTSVDAGVRVRRGADLAYMRDLKLPRRVRPGQRVNARLVIQRYRGAREVRRIKLRIPSDIKRGSRRIILNGTDADYPEEGLFEAITIDLGEEEEDDEAEDESALDFGPQNIAQLREAVESLERFDGVRLYVDRTRGEGEEAFRDPEVRLSGRVSARVRVSRRR
jgi:hypothetical protein